MPPKPPALTLLLLTLLLVLASACTPSPTPAPDLETIVSIALTQTAAALPPQATPQPTDMPNPPVETPAAPGDTPAPSATQPPEAPVLQPVTFLGVTFAYDPASYDQPTAAESPAAFWLPIHMGGFHAPGDPPTGLPNEIHFSLTSKATGREDPLPALSIYPIRDASGAFYPGLADMLSPTMLQSLDHLHRDLATGLVRDPFFIAVSDPHVDAHARRLNFQNGAGFAALGSPAGYDAPALITNDNLYYVFGGLTTDGKYYVEARFPLQAQALDDLPELSQAEITSLTGDMEAYQEYMAEINRLLDASAPEQFSPTLTTLDAMIASIQVEPVLSPPPTPRPTATTSPPTSGCVDEIDLVRETVQDNTTFAPEQAFVKSWRLRNSGTCTWTPAYTLVFVEGDQMGGASPVALGSTVEPGKEIDIAVSLTAPKASGTYKGMWRLRNEAGVEFGLNRDRKAFWVQIRVSPTGASTHPGLGVPTWLDPFTNDTRRWDLGRDTNTEFSLQDGFLVLTAFDEAAGDQWRISSHPGEANFYVEMKVTTGDTCSGQDGYGFVLRASRDSGGAFNHGYVFNFACSGEFRVYRMDGEYVGLQRWTTAPGLRAGPDQTNVVGVMALDDTLTVFINGVQVAQVYDGTYETGKLGLVIRARETAGFQAWVDEMSYWSLPD